MQKFLTTNNKEIYYQPLQIMVIDSELLAEDTLKEIRTLITIAAKKHDAHIVLSQFTYAEMDCILEVDIAISSEDKVNCTYALNFLRDSISALFPYAELLTEPNEQSLQGIKRDWNSNSLNP